MAIFHNDKSHDSPEISEEKLTKKQKRLKQRKAGRKIINTIMGIIVFCTLLGVCSGVSTIALILSKSDVTLNANDLSSSEVSIIYDADGNEITRVGTEDRINVSYSELPQCVIDAFVSVEDSRFYEHSGFDLPRFTKAILVNLSTLDFSQGGSTLTMQVIKNTYFAVDTVAEKSVTRKVQEIYFAIKISTLVSKEKIFELYVNKINYGASARGIEVAAEYYFDKSATELTLVEAAMLAGLVQAPNLYNPYYYPTSCQERTAEVLYLMNLHGYITDEEYELALSVNVIDLLCGVKEVTYEDGTTISNQAYIDTVLTELEEVYGIDAYTTSVRVYTGMNSTLQAYLDSVANGEVVSFKDAYMNYANAVVENYTGLIVGICGGRGYSSARQYNYATDARITPASTAKAIIVYPLAFEYVGISTGHYETIEPINLDGSSIRVREDSGKYYGEVSIQRSFCNSYNVAAIKLLRQVRSTIGDAAIINYLIAIGLDEDVAEAFNEQFAIGGLNCYISPLQLAGAASMLLSDGLYTTPHTITRIEYTDATKEAIDASWTSTQVLSAGAAYLTTLLMRYTVTPSLATSGDVSGNSRVTKFSGSYPVYGKTGTSSLPESMISSMGWPDSGAKDQWLIVATNKFTIGSWIGYDYSKGYNSTSYLSLTDRSTARDGTIIKGVLAILASEYGVDKTEKTAPSTVTKITHIRALYPYTSLPDYCTDTSLTITGYILKQYATLAEWEEPTIENPETLYASYNSSTHTVSVTTSEYPDSDKLTVESTTLEMTWTGTSTTWSGKRSYSATWIDGIVQYNYVLYDSSGNVVSTVTSSSNTATFTLTDIPTTTEAYTVQIYFAYSIAPVQSSSLVTTVYITGEQAVVEDPVTDES